MAEIGVQSGGSLLMWRHAFGQKLQRLGPISFRHPGEDEDFTGKHRGIVSISLG